MPRLPFAAAVAATFVAACASTGSMPSDMTPSTRAEYVNMAAASDLFEIQSSQLAVSRATRPEVREFAQMLITDHTNSTQQITAAATASGYTPPPPTLLPNQAAMITTLQNTSGADFDRVYLSQQIPAHQNALALHQNYANNGDTPSLRTVAAAVVPVVQSHLTHARQLSGQ